MRVNHFTVKPHDERYILWSYEVVEIPPYFSLLCNVVLILYCWSFHFRTSISLISFIISSNVTVRWAIRVVKYFTSCLCKSNSFWDTVIVLCQWSWYSKPNHQHLPRISINQNLTKSPYCSPNYRKKLNRAHTLFSVALKHMLKIIFILKFNWFQ